MNQGISLKLAYLFAILNAAIIGLSFSVTKFAVGKIGTFETLGWRFLFAFIVFSGYIFLSGKRLEIDIRGMIRLLPLAVFYPIGFFGFQAFGLLYTGSGEAGIINASIPVITTILAAIFIGEKTNLMQCVFIGISVAGVLYIAYKKSTTGGAGEFEFSRVLGLSLVLLSCFASAGYVITNRVLVRSFGHLEITFALMLYGVIVFVPAAIASRIHQGTLAELFVDSNNVRIIAAIFYLGLFASLLTSLFTSLALKRISSSQQAIFMNLSTLIAILLGYFFLDEKICGYHIPGTALIILGVLGTNRYRPK